MLRTASRTLYSHVLPSEHLNPDIEREGVLRAQAQAEINLPERYPHRDVKVLFGRLVQQIFINLPLVCSTCRSSPLGRTLVEDFAVRGASRSPPCAPA